MKRLIHISCVVIILFYCSKKKIDNTSILGDWYFIDNMGYNELLIDTTHFIVYNSFYEILYFVEEYLISDESIYFVRRENDSLINKKYCKIKIIDDSTAFLKFEDYKIKINRLEDNAYTIDSIKDIDSYVKYIKRFQERNVETFFNLGIIKDTSEIFPFDSSDYYNYDADPLIRDQVEKYLKMRYGEDGDSRLDLSTTQKEN